MSSLALAIPILLFTAAFAWWDWKTRTLPNWLTVTALLCGLAFHTFTGGWSGLGVSLGGFLAGFGVLFVLWLIGGGGGGDVKMMGALGAWLGAPLIMIVVVASAFLALAAMIAAIVWKAIFGGAKPSQRALIPYAIPVSLATWCLVLLKLAG